MSTVSGMTGGWHKSAIMWVSAVEGMTVGKGFPSGRKTACCELPAKSGESVIVINGSKKIILHRRCLVPIIDDLPLDAKDYNAQFKKIQKEIAQSGKFFPERKKRGHKRQHD